MSSYKALYATTDARQYDDYVVTNPPALSAAFSLNFAGAKVV